MSENIYVRARYYTSPKKMRRAFEIILTLFLTCTILVLSCFVLRYSALLSMLFIIPLGLFIARCFVIQHDCSHGSLFKKNRNNQWLGRLISLITFTPFGYWRRLHMAHHKHNSKLNHRGIGDVPMRTVKEYRNASKLEKILYRLFRNPLLLLFVIAPFYFIVIFRFYYIFHTKSPGYKRSLTLSIYLTNIALLIFYGSLCYLLGYHFLLIVLLPSLICASMIGTWLFYVQDTFHDSYFVREDNDWSHMSASFKGSSYYHLPWPLEWLTGYIGYHHIHHFNCKIPFYRLREAFNEVQDFQSPKTYGLKDSIGLAKLVLYNEEVGRFITWKQYRAMKY